MLRFTLCILAATFAASSALAQIGDPAPANPCAVPSGAFKTKLAVLDVTSDGVAVCGPVLAETAITCVLKEADSGGVSADVAIEYFDEAGKPMNGGAFLGEGTDFFCANGVFAPSVGDSFTFTLSPPMPGPWVGVPGLVPVPAGSALAPCLGAPGCALHGYARIWSTSKKLQCTGTRIDTSALCLGAAPGPLTTKNLTVIKIPRQKGD
jgi:hypothetical protein